MKVIDCTVIVFITTVSLKCTLFIKCYKTDKYKRKNSICMMKKMINDNKKNDRSFYKNGF